MALIAQDVKLGLDGRWNLEDLSEATREYVQLYGFAYSLMSDLPSDPPAASTASKENSVRLARLH